LLSVKQEEEQDNWFTPKKVLAYCMIIGSISGTLSIFINSLLVLSVGAFAFVSITVWYMFADKFQRWEERRRRTKEKYFLSLHNSNFNMTQDVHNTE
jgi:hypothetical protein